MRKVIQIKLREALDFINSIDGDMVDELTEDQFVEVGDLIEYLTNSTIDVYSMLHDFDSEEEDDEDDEDDEEDEAIYWRGRWGIGRGIGDGTGEFCGEEGCDGEDEEYPQEDTGNPISLIIDNEKEYYEIISRELDLQTHSKKLFEKTLKDLKLIK